MSLLLGRNSLFIFFRMVNTSNTDYNTLISFLYDDSRHMTALEDRKFINCVQYYVQRPSMLLFGHLYFQRIVRADVVVVVIKLSFANRRIGMVYGNLSVSRVAIYYIDAFDARTIYDLIYFLQI